MGNTNHWGNITEINRANARKNSMKLIAHAGSRYGVS